MIYTFQPITRNSMQINLGDKVFEIDLTSKLNKLNKIKELIDSLTLLSKKINGKSSEEAFKAYQDSFNQLMNIIFTNEQIDQLKEFYNNDMLLLYNNFSNFMIKGFFPAIEEESKRYNKMLLNDVL